MSMILKKVNTAAVTISLSIDTDAGKIEGSFVGHARIRSKKESMKMLDDALEAAAEGKIEDADAQLVTEIYERFDGLENESGKLEGQAAFAEVLEGQFSAYLIPACVRAYYQNIGESARGNSKRSRAR